MTKYVSAHIIKMMMASVANSLNEYFMADQRMLTFPCSVNREAMITFDY